jgi:outer membrane cobalamin receptor
MPASALFRSVAVAALATLAALARPAAASTTVQLDPFEIIAHPSGTDERTASVWIVRADDHAPPPARLADRVNLVPGVLVDRAGGPGGRSTIYTRGTEENHTLVLLDGVPINDPTDSRGGGVDLSSVEPALVDSVAVVRGPASVRHGPEALGGILHLDTRSPAASGLRGGIELGGDFHRVVLEASHAFAERVHGALGASASSDGSVEEGGRTRLHLVRASFRRDGDVSWRGNVWTLRHRADVFPDDSGGYRLAILRETEARDETRTGIAVRAESESDWGRWSAAFDASHSDVETETPGVAPGLRDPAGLPPITSDTDLRRIRARFALDRAGDHGTFGFGLDAQHEKGRDESTIFFGPFAFPADFALERNRGGLFAEGTRRLGTGILLAAGIRHDLFDGEDDRTTARAGVLGTLPDGRTQWRVNAGTAYKPPSFYALAHPIVGNPDLAAESVRSAEVGLRRAFHDGRTLLDATVFVSRTRNAVDFDPGPPPRVANIDGLRSRGVEFALDTRISAGVRLRGALTHVDARAQPDGTRMRSRPRWFGSVSGAWRPLEGLELAATLTGASSTPASSIPTGDLVLGSWIRLDLAASQRLSERVSATASLDNALDREYEVVVGFPAQKRRLRVGLNMVF